MENTPLSEFSKKLYEKLCTESARFDKVILMSHENTDFDGVAAVLGIKYVIQTFIRQYNNKVIAFLHSPNQSSSEALRSLEFIDDIFTKLDEFHNPNDRYLVLIMDSNNLDKIIGVIPKEQIDELILIDHHEIPTFLREGDFSTSHTIEEELKLYKERLHLWYVDSDASSCAEIISELWRSWAEITGIKEINGTDPDSIQKRIAMLLLLGILSDSANLRYSQNSVIPRIQFLLSKGADLQQVRKLSTTPISIDERIAKIKGAIRVEEPILIIDKTNEENEKNKENKENKVNKKNTWIVLFTTVNSFEAAVCRSLIDLGADIVFCLSMQKKKEFRLIVRSSERFQKESKINFGPFMEELGIQFQGHGGGHSGAAGMNGKECPDNLKRLVIQKVEHELEKNVNKRD